VQGGTSSTATTDTKALGSGGERSEDSSSPGALFINKLQDPGCDSCRIVDILSYRDIENPTNIYNVLIYHVYRFIGKPQGSKVNFGATS